MGRRKFKLGRHHKNYERKRQAQRRNNAGRPSKAGRLSPVPTSVSPPPPRNSDHTVCACTSVGINDIKSNA